MVLANVDQEAYFELAGFERFAFLHTEMNILINMALVN